MATQIKIRRDTYANWFNVNPTLGIGEPGYDITNRKLKIGDGATLWRALGYFDDQVTDLSAYAGSIAPSANITHSLGTPTARWQKGFFSDNAVYLGDIKLSNSNGTLVVQRVTNAGLSNEAAVPSTPGSVTTDRLTNGANTVSLAANGNLVTPAFTIPNTAGTSGQVLKWPSSGTTLVWALDNNTGVSLPTNAAGVLTNNGSGTLSWTTASADRLVNGANEVVLGSDGKLTLPGGAGLQSVGVTGASGRQSLASTRTDGSLFLTANSATAGDVYLMGQQNYIISASNISNGATYKTWTFGQSGNITLPAGGDIVDNAGNSVLGGAAGISITDFGRGFVNTLDSGKITTNKLYNRPENLALNNHYELSVTNGGVVALPDGSIINGATLKTIPGNYAGITAGPASPAGKDEDSWMWVDNNGATISTKTSTDNHTWHFDNNGDLNIPPGGTIRDAMTGDDRLRYYDPDDTDHWNEPAINTISAALDELAARVTAFENYEIDGGNAYTPALGELLIDGNGD